LERNATNTGSQLGHILSPVDDIKLYAAVLFETTSNAAMLRAFEYQLSLELGGESLFFLTDTSEWKASYSDMTTTAATARAKKLAQTYIKMNGVYQVNISHSMATRLLHELSHNPEVPFTLFDEARVEIAGLLEYGAVKRFVKSPEHRVLVSEGMVAQIMG
jgi:hypothetical protein